MKLTSVALAASFVATSTGCATVFAPGPDRVPITSSPAGARVYVDDLLVGQTPAVIELDRDRNQGRIRIEAEGYHPAVLVRGKDIQGWFWCNFCFGGLIGFVVDLATQNYRSFDDTPIAIYLIPVDGPVPGYPVPSPVYPPPYVPAQPYAPAPAPAPVPAPR
jgi:hypothetical protein